MLHNFLGVVEGALSFMFMPVKQACAIVLRSLKIEGASHPDDKTKYISFKENHPNGIIVYHSTTFYDHLVIMHELSDPFRFISPYPYLLGSPIWLPSLLRRKQNTSMTAAAFQCANFQTKQTILPVIIQYDPTHTCKSLFSHFWQTPVSYTLRVLDPIIPSNAQTPYEIAHKVKMEMVHALSAPRPILEVVKDPRLTGTIGCLGTSHFFIIFGIMALARRLFIYGIAMCIIFVTSWLYHGTNDVFWRKIDIISNIVWTTICGAMVTYTRQYYVVGSLLFAGVSYFFDLDHATFVHIPVAIAFALVR